MPQPPENLPTQRRVAASLPTNTHRSAPGHHRSQKPRRLCERHIPQSTNNRQRQTPENSHSAAKRLGVFVNLPPPGRSTNPMRTANVLIQRVTSQEMAKLTAIRQRITSIIDAKTGGEKGEKEGPHHGVPIIFGKIARSPWIDQIQGIRWRRKAI